MSDSDAPKPDGAFPFLKKSPEALDRILAEKLLPQFRGSKSPLDHAALAAAAETIGYYRKIWHENIAAEFAVLEDRNEKQSRRVKELQASVAHGEAELQEAKRQVRAALEGRGVFESKRVKELEAAVAAKLLEIERWQRTVQEKDQEITGLRNEVVALRAMGAGYERDIESLTTAAAANAEGMRCAKTEAQSLIQKVQDVVRSALEKIDDRWPREKISPYLDSVRGDIAAGLKILSGK